MQAPLKKFEREQYISNWVRDYSCDILAKNMAVFCPCSKNLSKDKIMVCILWFRRIQDSLNLLCYMIIGYPFCAGLKKSRANEMERNIKCTV